MTIMITFLTFGCSFFFAVSIAALPVPADPKATAPANVMPTILLRKKPILMYSLHNRFLLTNLHYHCYVNSTFAFY